jgi:heavy metal sensor kinase
MTAWYVVLLAAIIATVGAFLVLRLHADLVAAMDSRLNPAVDQIALGYHAEGAPEAHDVSATVLSGERAASQVLTPAGRVVASFGDAVAKVPMVRAGELRHVTSGRRIVRTTTLGSTDRRFRIVARATTRGIYSRVVVAGESMATIDRSVHRLLILLLLAGPAALAATAAGGWWLARRALLPIGRLTDDAGRIEMERLSQRLPVPAAGDEVARLATTLNTMLARIQAGVDEQHRLVADASHELRTPLAAMRAELDVSLRADDLDPDAQAVLRSTLEEVERLTRTVDGLLTLTRADQGALDLRPQPVDLAVVAGEAVGRLRALAGSRGVTVDVDADPAAAVADAAWAGRAIDDLLDNAIKFSPAGATVTVTTATVGDEALVRVLDEGPGIPAEAREAVFDRFQRLDASRTRATGGSGIGLAIVREIAGAHGGRVWVEPGLDGGSVFTLALPRAAADAATTAPPPGTTVKGAP